MPVPVTASRRALLAGSGAVAGSLVVAACDGDAGPGGLGGLGPGTDAPADADAEVLASVRADLAAMAAWTAAAARRHPRQAAHWADLRAMHREHARALDDGQATPSTDPDPVPRDQQEALRAARRREQLHQQRLVEAAVAVASGPLARVLASMAAAVSQRLAGWPAPSGSAAPTSQQERP